MIAIIWICTQWLLWRLRLFSSRECW